MKIVSYLDDHGVAYGVVEGDRVVPASAAFRARFPGVRAVLAGDALEALRADTAGRAAERSLAGLRYLPPVPDTARVHCVGINYPKRYPLDAPAPLPDNIILFGKFDGALVGHGEPLELPRGEAAATFDYEGEIVVVIGRGGRHIAEADAMRHVAGWTIMDDGSVRGWQKHSLHAGKNFARSGGCGPWLVTADEIADPATMTLTTRLNGEQVQHTSAAAMIFPVPQVIAYVSGFTELRPGDLVATGSPEGAGGSRTPPRFLREGDEIEIEVSGVGVLRNRVGPST